MREMSSKDEIRLPRRFALRSMLSASRRSDEMLAIAPIGRAPGGMPAPEAPARSAESGVHARRRREILARKTGGACVGVEVCVIDRDGGALGQVFGYAEIELVVAPARRPHDVQSDGSEALAPDGQRNAEINLVWKRRRMARCSSS